MLVIKRNRSIPRPFEFKGEGRGDIIEEASVEYQDWAPAIQLLKFENGKIGLRFCYYAKSGRLAPRALWLTEDNIADLRKVIAKQPQIRRLLRQLL